MTVQTVPSGGLDQECVWCLVKPLSDRVATGDNLELLQDRRRQRVPELCVSFGDYYDAVRRPPRLPGIFGPVHAALCKGSVFVHGWVRMRL